MSRSVLFKKITSLIQQASFKNDREERVNSSRREFLKSTLTTSASIVPAAGVLSSCVSRVPRNVASIKNESPVVILGAGIAGLTAAYYLTKASVPCVIYEASSRLGGRMFTQSNFNADGMTCELGGELVDTGHQEIIALCQELGIAIDEFALGDAGLAANLYYFNKTYYTDRELIPLFQPFANRLVRDIRKIKSPALAKKMDSTSLEEYLLEFHDVEKWVIDLIRVAYVGEYGLEASEQSALGLIYTISPSTKNGFKMYGDSDEAKKIRGGNSALIEALESFLNSSGVQIYTQTPVLKIAELSSGVQVTLARGNTTEVVVSKRVICTIPFSVLRTIDGISELNLDPIKKKCIQELGYATCSKMMLGYQNKLWRSGLKKDSRYIPASNGTVYTDLAVQILWETSRTQKGNSGILTSFLGGNSGASMQASRRHAFTNHIDEIYPGTRNILDNSFAFMNWTVRPYNLGAYASPKPGQTLEFGKIEWQPELSGQLIFAGEHVADRFQGYMNGGCRSGLCAADFILKKKAAA
jgi:monoamine oxidase